MASNSRSAFFYGTLMAPSVLRRVTGRMSASDSNDPNADPPLSVRRAVLDGFRRHRVQYCDYPAMVPVDPSSDSFAVSEVRGTYVSGLTDADVLRLDAFEGGEYERWVVKVRVLPFVTDTMDPPSGEKQTQEDMEAMRAGGTKEGWAAAEDEDGELKEAETYVWISSPSDLENDEWDFDDFVEKRLWLWAGGDPDPGFEDAQNVDIAKHLKENDGVVDTTRGRSFKGGEFEKRMNNMNA